MNTKTITGYLVVDWKAEQMRARKTKGKRSELGTNELMGKLEVTVNIPEKPDLPTLAMELDVPEAQLRAATMDALSDEAMPDWTDTATTVIEDHQDDIEATHEADFWELVDMLTARTVIADSGQPRPEQVREFIAEVVADMTGDEVAVDAEAV